MIEDIRRSIGLLKTNLGAVFIVPSDPFIYDRRNDCVSCCEQPNTCDLCYPRFAHDGGLMRYNGVPGWLITKFVEPHEYVGRILNGVRTQRLAG